MSGAGSIPISEILALCQMVGIANPELRAKYLDLIQDLDEIWLKHWADKQPKGK